MKKAFFIAAALIAASSVNIQAFDIKGALKKAVPSGGSTTDLITGALNGVLSTDKIDVAALAGEWTYNGPAVNFKSENLLKKAGGAAVASTIESKIEPVYKISGIDKLQLTVEKDGTFAMKVRGITLKGTIIQNTDESSMSNFVFNFNAGTLKIGKIDAYVEKSLTSGLSVMFDVSKLMTIIKTVSKVAGNSTINTLTSTLDGYDGICAGFRLK